MINPTGKHFMLDEIHLAISTARFSEPTMDWFDDDRRVSSPNSHRNRMDFKNGKSGNSYTCVIDNFISEWRIRYSLISCISCEIPPRPH